MNILAYKMVLLWLLYLFYIIFLICCCLSIAARIGGLGQQGWGEWQAGGSAKDKKFSKQLLCILLYEWLYQRACYTCYLSSRKQIFFLYLCKINIWKNQICALPNTVFRFSSNPTASALFNLNSYCFYTVNSIFAKVTKYVPYSEWVTCDRGSDISNLTAYT